MLLSPEAVQTKEGPAVRGRDSSTIGRGGIRGRRRLTPGSPDYPPALRRVPDGRPVPVTAWGRLDALGGPLLGFFCSVRARGDALLKTYDLARALRGRDVTLVGGFQSPMEKEFLDLLLRGSARAVLCPARGLGVMRLSPARKAALADGRLLVLSFFDDALRRPTAAVAAERNARVAALAGRLLVAHAEPGGKTERLCRDALARGQPVFTLDSPDNAHLAALGVAPVSADDPAPLLADGTEPTA